MVGHARGMLGKIMFKPDTKAPDPYRRAGDCPTFTESMWHDRWLMWSCISGLVLITKKVVVKAVSLRSPDHPVTNF